MGWLRQSWQRAGCGSAKELAELLLAHEDVPSSMSIKASSLANNLRSLDRGKRLGWWRRHHQLIAPLASVLAYGRVLLATNTIVNLTGARDWETLIDA